MYLKALLCNKFMDLNGFFEITDPLGYLGQILHRQPLRACQAISSSKGALCRHEVTWLPDTWQVMNKNPTGLKSRTIWHLWHLQIINIYSVNRLFSRLQMDQNHLFPPPLLFPKSVILIIDIVLYNQSIVK